jgi:hypothetical protein
MKMHRWPEVALTTQGSVHRRATLGPFVAALLAGAIAVFVAGVLVAGTAANAFAEKVIWQYDDLPGDMEVLADNMKKHPMSAHPGFVKTEAFGQIFQPAAGDYPVKILSVELVMAAPESAQQPFPAVPALIEFYNDDALGAAPSGAPIWSVGTADFFNPVTKQPGMSIQGNTAMIYEFDWSKPENHPPLINQGLIRVVIRILGNAGDNGEKWEPGCSTGVIPLCQCAKQDFGMGLELCGCQELAALTDAATTPKANVLHIVYPIGSCSGSKKWLWLEDVAKEGKAMKGDFILRMGVDGVGGGSGGTDAGNGGQDAGTVADTSGGIDAGVDVGPPKKPTIDFVTPSSLKNDKLVIIEIIGSDFEPGAKAQIGTNKLPVDAVTPTKITASVLAGLTPGVYDVVVENTNGQIGFKAAALTILDGAPPVDASVVDGGNTTTDAAVDHGVLNLDNVDPKCVSAALDTEITIYGTGFAAGMVLELGGNKLSAVSVVTPSKATALVPKGLAPGPMSLVVTRDSQVDSLANAVEVGCGATGAPAPSGCSANHRSAPGRSGLLVVVFAALIGLMLRRRVAGTPAA